MASKTAPPAPLFRYPGGKTKICTEIVGRLRDRWSGDVEEYREPFFGGGSVGTWLLRTTPSVRRVWVNDKDPGIACLWTAVIRSPDLLIDKVRSFCPSVGEYHRLKGWLLAGEPVPRGSAAIAEYGFRKLAIHQMSYSGLGTRSGGPIGGESQASGYPVGCRWSPDRIAGKISGLNALFAGVEVRHGRCTCLDFGDVIGDDAYASLLYLDPPYYLKGSDLYQCQFSVQDHRRLRQGLMETDHEWVLSYDDAAAIRRYYSWASIDEIDAVRYSITGRLSEDASGRREGRSVPELLITRR